MADRRNIRIEHRAVPLQNPVPPVNQLGDIRRTSLLIARRHLQLCKRDNWLRFYDNSRKAYCVFRHLT